MQTINTLFISLCAFLFVIAPAFAAENISPVGYWKTIDDVSGQTKSIVQVTELPNKLLIGKVTKLFNPSKTICSDCQGERKDKPILGMIVMEDLKKDTTPGLWSNGNIIDPKNGKQYHCNIQVMSHGEKLKVRGYVGVPLFGRSQTWLRATDKDLA